jgi:putative transposase
MFLLKRTRSYGWKCSREGGQIFKGSYSIRKCNFMPQSLSRILLHLIFSTKNRKSYFASPIIRKDLHAYLAATANHLGSPAICVGGVADHVHLVCSLNRTTSVATFVAKIKVSSNQAVRERHLSQFSWQNGYAAFSVAESTLKALTQYVSEQEIHHQKFTFQDEYRAFLKRHNVPFDERYVWD